MRKIYVLKAPLQVVWNRFALGDFTWEDTSSKIYEKPNGKLIQVFYSNEFDLGETETFYSIKNGHLLGEYKCYTDIKGFDSSCVAHYFVVGVKIND